MSQRERSPKWITVNGTEYKIMQEVDTSSGMVTGLLVSNSGQSGHIHFYYDTVSGLFGSHLKIKNDLVGEMRVTAWDLSSVEEELQKQGYFNFEH